MACTKKGSQFVGKFTPRTMEVIVNSEVFMYPDLLPKIPFRRKPNQSVRGAEFPNSELSLIAFGLDLFNGILSEELNRFNPAKQRKPTISKVIDYIIRFLCPTRTFAGLRSSIDVYSKEELMNPIKVSLSLFLNQLIFINSFSQLPSTTQFTKELHPTNMSLRTSTLIMFWHPKTTKREHCHTSGTNMCFLMIG